MKATERPLVFRCNDHPLVGILHQPGVNKKRQGVLIVTGGPQYRVGSHRQFVLLAREIAAAGYPVFRFDYHGMGDSGGPPADFTACQADIAAAISVFKQEAGIAEFVLWGLCDAASACLISILHGTQPSGLVLINPWVRSDEGLARSHLRHYYLRRFFSREFRDKLLAGDLNIGKIFRDFRETCRNAFSRRTKSSGPEATSPPKTANQNFRHQMRDGLARFEKPVLLVLCGDDLTAKEFVDYTNRDELWRGLLGRQSVVKKALPDADHTFSRQDWRRTISGWTIEWLEKL